ncbi:hypothetical protein BDY24DRAFT_250454 [Mrakia frigida]|uniref:uncharacterized protein n=1 Tax=Mrakia frigida TaxID=29902 RepID=UPI003FCC140A
MSSEQPKSSSRKRPSSSGATTPSASGSGASTPRGGRRTEKVNRPKPRARQKMKAAKLKQEEEDAILAANSFVKDEDDPMGEANQEEEEGEEGEEVEVMDLAGLGGGSSDLDEEMVEAAITSRPASLPPVAIPTAPAPSSSIKPVANSHGLPSKPIAPLPSQRRRSPTFSPEPITHGASSNLFYVDIIPKAPKKTRQWIDPVAEAEAAALAALEPQEEGEVEEIKDTLVLPSHIVIERPAPAGGDQEGAGEGVLTEAEVFAGELGAIEFLDGVDDRPASRYFDAQPEGGAAFGAGGKASMVCNICKQRGHVQRECTMQICLTCGAVDEHTTRSCPVALVCFACGGRGHRSRECTAPRSQQRHRGGGPMCDRCGSDVHPANVRCSVLALCFPF